MLRFLIFFVDHYNLKFVWSDSCCCGWLYCRPLHYISGNLSIFSFNSLRDIVSTKWLTQCNVNTVWRYRYKNNDISCDGLDIHYHILSSIMSVLTFKSAVILYLSFFNLQYTLHKVKLIISDTILKVKWKQFDLSILLELIHLPGRFC